MPIEIKRTLRVAFATLILLGMNLSMAFAQLPTATILGVVKDSSGAVVPDATVTAMNVETGQKRTVSAAGEGSYRVSALPVGSYEVRVEHAGFQAGVRSGLTLTVGQEAVVNFTLEVGSVGQAVTVSADAPLVNTTSGSLGSLVTSQQVSDLPLNGRNYVDLTLLQPGVAQFRTTNSPAGTTSVNNTPGTWMSINGATVRSNYFTLDGAPLNNYSDAVSSSFSGDTLGIEAIREWRVVTNAFSADYGMRLGGQIVIVSKGGTNSFHGSLYEYLRNNALDARNFFDYKSTAVCPNLRTDPNSCTWRLPAFRRNQYGVSAGGPIKKDKLFFFANYEALRERLGVSTISNTIGAGCQGLAGATITSVACPQLGATASVTVAPVMAPILALYPAPNLPNNQFTFPFTAVTNENYGMVRGDYNISASDSAFVRYTIDDANVASALPFPQFVRVGSSRGQFLTSSDSHTFSSAVVGTFRFSFSRPGLSVNNTSTVPAGPQYSLAPGQLIGAVSIGGVSNFGTQTANPSSNMLDVFTYSADMFYSKGRHSLKFGTLVNHELDNSTVAARPRGTVTFPSVATFLQGISSAYDAVGVHPEDSAEYSWSTLGFYLQDDIRVRSNLTLNLGLRYEIQTEVNVGSGNSRTLRDVRRDAALTPGPIFLNPSLKNFGPRFGFAWDVKGDGKTSVRGGFAEMYDINVFTGFVGNGVNDSLQSWRNTNASVSASQTPQYALITSLPLLVPPELAGRTIGVMDYHLKNPHMLTYNLTMERQLPYDMALSVGYVGSRGINLLSNKAANPRLQTVLPDGRFFWTGTEPRVNPNWDGIIQMTTAVSSWYNALQVSLTKRLSHGLQFQPSYTFSKEIDQKPGVGGPDQSGGATNTATQLLPLSLDKGPGDSNATHSFHFTTTYHLPGVVASRGIGGTLLNGWWLSSVFTAVSGNPFTVTTGGVDQSRSLGAGNLPDLNVGRNNSNITSGTTAGCAGVAAGRKLGTPNLYYDPCAFTLETAGFLGTEGRNILTGPGLTNLDFSLVKDTKVRFLGEGGNVEFRAEIFNILNHANFTRPNTGVLSAPSAIPLATAGTILATDTKSRDIQLALKVIW